MIVRTPALVPPILDRATCPDYASRFGPAGSPPDIQPLVAELRRELDALRVELVNLRRDVESMRSTDS